MSATELPGAYEGCERESCARAAADLLRAARAHSLTLAVAESLTGGQVSSSLVEIPGASRVLVGAVVAYATRIKAQVLGVDAAHLERTGPVDRDVALQMADGVRRLLGADVGLATTGVAGPGPADGHAAGTVWVACTGKLGERARLCRFHGGRSDVRAQAVEAAVDLLTELLCMTLR